MTVHESTTLRPVSDEAALRTAYSCFPSGVVAVCAWIDDTPIGMAASSFATVSLEPPLVSVCVKDTSTTWPRLRAAPSLGVSVFASDHDRLCRQMAGPSERRFDGVDPLIADDGALFVRDCAAVLACEIHDEIVAGDHIVVLLRITGLDADPGVEPLVFHASTFRALEVRD